MCVCVHMCVCSRVCVFTYVCVPGRCQPLSAPRDGGGPAQCLFLCVPPELGSQAPPLPGHPLLPVPPPALPPWAQLGFAIAHISWGSFVDGVSSLALSLWLLDEAGGERVRGPACPRQDAQLQGQETQPADPRQPGRQEGPGVPLTPPGHVPSVALRPAWGQPCSRVFRSQLLSPTAGEPARTSLRLCPLLCDTGDAGRLCPAGAELRGRWDRPETLQLAAGRGSRPATSVPAQPLPPPPWSADRGPFLPGLHGAPGHLGGPLGGRAAVLTEPPSLPQGEEGAAGCPGPRCPLSHLLLFYLRVL